MQNRTRMWSWLAEWLGREQRTERLQSLDLRAFVRDSATLEIDPGERLRLLAVYLDEQCMVDPAQPLAAWEVFSRIYAEAERLAPSHAWIFHSKAHTAVELAKGCSDEDTAQARLFSIAKRSAHAAIELQPGDADNHYMLGQALYFSEGEINEALESFERALEIDPKHAWSRLYRAHCLHDLERWAEAVVAYGEVDVAAFEGAAAWRMELLREQRAECMLRAERG